MAKGDRMRVIKQATEPELAAFHARETLASLRKSAEDFDTQHKIVQAEIDLLRPSYASARIVLKNPEQLPPAKRRTYEEVVELQERLEQSLRDLELIQKRKQDSILNDAEKFEDEGFDSKQPTLH